MKALQFYITTSVILLSLWSVNSLSAQGSSPTPSPNEIFKNAFSAFQQGNYDLAIKNYNLAIIADPTRNYFYYNRALTYKAMGNVPKAMDDLTTSLSYKQTAEAYYQIGLIKYEKNDLEGAKVEFENAKLIKNDIERMNFFLGMIYFHNNQYDEAIKCFYDYTSVVKNCADAYYYRGLAEAKLCSYQDALTSFKFAQMYKNSDWKLYYEMYEIYLAMNDKENAHYSLSMVIELGEKKPEHYEERARLFLRL